MGQFASSQKKKEDRPPVTASSNSHADESQNRVPVRRPAADNCLAKYAEVLREKGVIPDVFLVRETLGSTYVDEDGDEANEFYAETIDGKLRRLCRLVNNLRPKGKEAYSIPRLSPDLPVVIWELGGK